jgi:tryptophan synthase alpha chain
MSRIAKCFKELKERSRAAFIPYIACGDPDMETTAEIIEVLVESGADIIELGVPFSDPIADGPVIQRASVRALEAGSNLTRILAMVSELRSRGIETPFVLFGYCNPVIRYGIEKLAKDAIAAGVDGLLVADLIYEEAEEIDAVCSEVGLDRIYLVAPTSSDQRIAEVAQHASGFLYAISLVGVTGARETFTEDVGEFLTRVKAQTSLPVALGFGISNPDMVRVAARQADGVVVGSAIVRMIEDDEKRSSLLRRLGSFVREMAEATQI